MTLLGKTEMMVLNSFESLMRALLIENRYEYQDHSNSYNKLDYTVNLHNEAVLKLEIKEKRQPVKRSNWPVPKHILDEDIFILDDLTARKALLAAPFSAIAVQDRPRNSYYVADVLDLWSMPRVRVNRKISKNKYKGKWILSFRNFVKLGIYDILPFFETLFENKTLLSRYTKIPDVYGSFDGETVGEGGEERTDFHKKYDFNVTR